MKAQSLLFDNCIIDICNQNCEYCRPEPTRKVGGRFVSKAGTFSNEEALKRIRESIDRGYEHTDAPILKISGYGEVLLIQGVVELLKGYKKVVQIITNGTFLESVLDDIKESGIHVCVSLDGHTTVLNQARVKTQSHQDAVIHSLQAASARNIPLEINAVLTRYNTRKFSTVLDWLLEKDIDALVYPFPVRNNYLYGRGTLLYPERRDIDQFVKTVVHNYDVYSDVLPPYAYMERLTTFLYTRKRMNSCYIGLVTFCVNPQSTILKCCCGWDEPVGDIHSQSVSFSERMVHKTRVPSACVDCFTHYEVVNCFLDGETTLKELQEIALFRSKQVRSRLSYLKKWLKVILKCG